MNKKATNNKTDADKKVTLDLKALRASLRDPNHKGFKGQRFNRYDLLSEIARGGMGVVFRAKHVELGSLVALKLLASDPTPESAGRFRREAKVLAQLKHPHVVGISDLGASAGIHFLAMELIEGPDLHEVVTALAAKSKYLPYARTVEVTLAMAKALDYCHEQGAVHRDIKPQNILVEHKTDRPVLTDFGLVKRDKTKMQSGQSGAVSQAGKILGTPSFMAPEQFEPDGIYGAVGEKTDVWGLGATLFYMLTGNPPFRAGNVVELYSQVMNEPPPRTSAVRPGVPPVLDELVAACLTKPVAERISMAELVRRLEEVQKTPKALDGATPSSGMRHAVMVIVLFAVLTLLDLAVLEQDKGKRVLAWLKGEPPPTAGDEPDGPTPDAPATDEPATDAPSDPKPANAEPVDAAARVQRMRRLANDGEVDVMVALGKVLAASDSAMDHREAADWLQKAAEQKNAEAMFRLGRLYMKGVGVEKNDATASQWLKDAANGGSVTAMLWLGEMNIQGRVSGEPDPKEAVAWFNRVIASAGPKDQKARDMAQKELDGLFAKHKDLGQ